MRTPFKMLTVAVAGSCLLALTPALAMAQDATPVVASVPVTAVPINAVLPAAQAVAITTKVIEENTDLIKASIKLPVLSGMADQKYQEQLNAGIEQQANKLLAQLKAESKDNQESAAKNDYPAHPYEMDVSYELKSDGGAAAGGILSFTVSTYTYTGGAHGGTFEEGYNIVNEATASPLTLEKALGDGGLAAANRAVRYSFQADPDRFYPDALQTFKGVTPEQTFFVAKGVPTLVYQQYDLAPYAGGIIEVPVDETTSAGPSAKLTRGELSTAGSVRYVPLRKAAETLGYTVKWANATHTATLSRDAESTSLTVGKNGYALNKAAPLKLSAAPKMIGGKLYVPDEFFAKILKLNVVANAKDGSLTITG